MLPKKLLVFSGAILAFSGGLELLLGNEEEMTSQMYNTEPTINLTAFEKWVRYQNQLEDNDEINNRDYPQINEDCPPEKDK